MSSFANHHANLHTEELIQISHKELLDESRTALNAELKSRDGTSAQFTQMYAEVAAELEHAARLASLRKRPVAFKFGLLVMPFGFKVILLPLLLISNDVHTRVFILLWVLYMLLRDAIPGQGIGKRLFQLRLVHRQTGVPCSWQRSIMRNLTHILFVLDWLFIIGDHRLRLEDRVAKTTVIWSSSPN
jgi:uncharacterized RDD family membrane protein YckC